MSKKILITVLAVFFGFVGTVGASAPTPPQTDGQVVEQSVKDFYKAYPEVYIDNITLDKETYVAGQTISGTYIMRNAKDMTVSKVATELSIGTNYENGVYGELFGTIKGAFISLKPFESREVKFTYTIPQALGGNNFGLNVRAVLDTGIYLGWDDAMITITDLKPAATVTQSALTVGEKVYPLQAGPTLEANAKPSLGITLTNTNNTSLTITPQVDIIDFVTGEKLTTLKDTQLILAAGQKKEITIALPMFDGKAGIYSGKIYFVDSQGALASAHTPFRYVIGGDIAHITGLSADKDVVTKGETVTVSMNYSGAPRDVETFAQTASTNADLTLRVYNERNKIIAVTKRTMDFNQGSVLQIPVVASGDAKALFAEVVAMKDGKELAHYASALSSNYDAARRNALQQKTVKFALAIGIIVAIILISYRAIRDRAHPFAVLILALVGVAAFASAPRAEAFTVDSFVAPPAQVQQWSRDFLGTQGTLGSPDGVIVTVNNPGEGEIMAPGEKFRVQVRTQSLACGNTPLFRVKVTATYRGVSYSNYVDTTINSTNNNKFVIDNIISMPSDFTAIQTLGSQEQVSIRVQTWTRQNGEWVEWVDLRGHQNFKIVDKPTVTFSGNPTTVSSGGQSTLTWTHNFPPGLNTNNYPGRTCLATGDWTGSKSGTNGSEVQSNITVAKNYTLRCSGVYRGVTIQSDPRTVSVGLYPPITGSCSVSPTAIATNGSARWTATASGGNGTYHYTWSGSDSLSKAGSEAFVQKTYTTAGVKTASVVIRSGTESRTIACSNNLTVTDDTPSVTASCSVNPSSINTGQAATWAATASGGNGLYSYAWTTSDNFAPGNRSSFSRNYNSVGRYTASVTVSSGGKTVTVNCTNSLTVGEPPVTPSPSVTLDADPNPVPRGEDVTLTWTSENTTNCNKSGAWSGTNVGRSGSTVIQNVTEVKNYTVTCFGPGGSDDDTEQVDVIDDIIFTCVAKRPSNNENANRAPVGAMVNFVVENGPDGVVYHWRSDGNPTEISGSGMDMKILPVIFSIPGPKTVRVRAEINNKSYSAVCNADVGFRVGIGMEWGHF
jgi:hypothetical protein